MRKLTTLIVALFITVSAVAAPINPGNSDRASAFTRIVRQIKVVIRALDDLMGQPTPPTPSDPRSIM